MTTRPASQMATRAGRMVCYNRRRALPISQKRQRSLSTSVTIPAVNVPLIEMKRNMEHRERLFRTSAIVAVPTVPMPNSVDDPDPIREAGLDRQFLEGLAKQKPTPLRLVDMFKYGTSHDLQQRLRNAQFLHKELPIRIAQRTVDLLTLPHGLSDVTPIRNVATVFLNYLKELQQMPTPRTKEQEDQFTDLLQSFVLDRASVPTAIARGVSAWREAGHEDLEMERLQEMEDALYRFFTARVGLRFLTEHHVLSSDRPSTKELRKVTNFLPPSERDDFSGCIQKNCDLVDETRRVADVVIRQTTDYYGMCPQIDIVDCIPEDTPRDFTYVLHHLHYMLAELLKNSCRATVQQYLNQELHGKKNQAKLHPIRVIIVKGDEDVTVKIADKGGGIPRSRMANIWKFGHSIADEEESKTEFGVDEGTGARIRGFGLPLARIYARYFGGELNLKSMEGYGVDAYLHLPRLGDSCENLPLRVRHSPGELDSMPSLFLRNYSTMASLGRFRPLPPRPATGRREDDTTQVVA